MSASKINWSNLQALEAVNPVSGAWRLLHSVSPQPHGADRLVTILDTESPHGVQQVLVDNETGEARRGSTSLWCVLERGSPRPRLHLADGSTVFVGEITRHVPTGRLWMWHESAADVYASDQFRTGLISDRDPLTDHVLASAADLASAVDSQGGLVSLLHIPACRYNGELLRQAVANIRELKKQLPEGVTLWADRNSHAPSIKVGDDWVGFLILDTDKFVPDPQIMTDTPFSGKLTAAHISTLTTVRDQYRMQKSILDSHVWPTVPITRSRFHGEWYVLIPTVTDLRGQIIKAEDKTRLGTFVVIPYHEAITDLDISDDGGWTWKSILPGKTT